MGGTGIAPAVDAPRVASTGPTGIPEIVLGSCLFFTMVLREGWYSPLLGTTIIGLAVVGDRLAAGALAGDADGSAGQYVDGEHDEGEQRQVMVSRFENAFYGPGIMDRPVPG